MSLSTEDLTAIQAEWHEAWHIYPVYLGIAERFSLHCAPCPELEATIDSADTALASVREWQQCMDAAIRVHQLRVFLQTSSLCTEEILCHLVRHHLRKENASDDADRDKLDFLLVQYFSHCVPPEAAKQPTLEDVAHVLRPVLGDAVVDVDAWEKPLEDALSRMKSCITLQELLQSRVLCDVRRIKKSAGRDYWSKPALIAFTRFNYFLRHAFFRLMQSDVEAVRQGVDELGRRGTTLIDCERAQLSRQEPLERVWKLCQQWRKPFQAEYSAGNPFAQIAQIRACIEQALAEPAEHKSAQSQNPEPGAAAELGENDTDPALESELNKLLLRLPAYLNSNLGAVHSGTILRAGDAQIELSPADVRAFLDDRIELASTRRAVACCLLLFQALAQAARDGSQEKLSSVRAFAQAEAARLRTMIEQADASGQEQFALRSTLGRLDEMIGRSLQRFGQN